MPWPQTMADDGTVRGCVYGAARHLHPHPAPIPDGLTEAIEATYQRLVRDGTLPMTRRGIDYEALARMHADGFDGQQMTLGRVESPTG